MNFGKKICSLLLSITVHLSNKRAPLGIPTSGRDTNSISVSLTSVWKKQFIHYPVSTKELLASRLNFSWPFISSHKFLTGQNGFWWKIDTTSTNSKLSYTKVQRGETAYRESAEVTFSLKFKFKDGFISKNLYIISTFVCRSVTIFLQP